MSKASDVYVYALLLFCALLHHASQVLGFLGAEAEPLQQTREGEDGRRRPEPQPRAPLQEVSQGCGSSHRLSAVSCPSAPVFLEAAVLPTTP